MKLSIYICVWPTIFGYRVRAAWNGNLWYELDYCAGAKQKDVEDIYEIVLAILKKHKKFDIFPYQERKPMSMAPICWQKLKDLAEGIEIEKVNFNGLDEMKRNYLKNLFKNEDP